MAEMLVVYLVVTKVVQKVAVRADVMVVLRAAH